MSWFSQLCRVVYRLAHRARDDGGFGIVELAVALGVMFTAMLGLIYTVTLGLRDTGFARQRQAMTGKASQLIEQVRGLAYDEVKLGLDSADLAGDPDVVTCSGVARYKSCTGERIVATAGRSAVVPLSPHRVSGVVGTTSYTRSVYVTAAAAPAGAYRVIARVQWSVPLSAGASPVVESQTLVYSPQGCRSTATHPFAAPCQPFFYATSSAPGPSIEIKGTVLADSRALLVAGPSARSDAQAEQVAHVQGSALTSQVSAGTTSLGASSVVSGADDDGATATPPLYQALTGSAEPSRTASATGTLGSDSYTVTASYTAADGDVPRSVSTGSSTSSNVCPTAPNPPAPETDSSACGRSSVTQLGALAADAALTLGSTALGTARLAEISVSAAPMSGFVDRDPLTSGSDPGRIVATSARTLGDVRLAKLPSGVTAPAGWDASKGLVSLTGYNDSAVAQAGTSAPVPTVTIGGGTISYWNGSGYTALSVPSGDSVTVPFASVSASGTVDGRSVQVQITGSLSSGGVVTVSTPGSQAGSLTAAEASAGPPLSGTLQYVVTAGSTTLMSVEVVVNLGKLYSTTSYQAAPIA